jgi:hypothetical protein
MDNSETRATKDTKQNEDKGKKQTIKQTKEKNNPHTNTAYKTNMICKHYRSHKNSETLCAREW